jgi:hypothetical protein
MASIPKSGITLFIIHKILPLQVFQHGLRKLEMRFFRVYYKITIPYEKSKQISSNFFDQIKGNFFIFKGYLDF